MTFRRFKLPRTVLVLGMVSFFNDIASEMITPLLPLFLTVSLGAGPAAIGLIEGVAEATASLLKLASGRMADRRRNHKKLVLGGYGISNIARPFIGLAGSWGGVLVLRFMDRIGKGVRTSPRDALISGAVDDKIRGRAFGFHRAMDHAGAMIGPLAAFGLLHFGVGLRDVFLISVIPGVALMILLARYLPADRPVADAPAAALSWRGLDRRLRALVMAAGGLAFATMPEAFLVLWVNKMGVTVLWVPLLWALAHAFRSVVAGAGGMLSDRWGRIPVVVVGWGSRVVLLAALALVPVSTTGAGALFLAYAGATASTEGAERALIGDAAGAEARGTAFGVYHMLYGILALPGALLFGILWEHLGMAVSLLTSGALTAVAALMLIVLSGGRKKT